MTMTTNRMLDHDRIEEKLSNVEELKSLLRDLASSNTTTSIRLKFQDNDWCDHYSQVLVFAKHATLLAHMPSRTVVHVPDLTQVTAFELDCPHKGYSPGCVYLVKEPQPTT
jgi:hypothetical protein